MATRTPTIDSQVHAYERNRPERPWRGFLQGPDEVTGDDMVAAMDAVGVDGALLVSPFAMYGYDASYALEVYAKHPGKFGLIKPFDPQSESIADEMAEWTGTPGVVGARIMLAYEPFEADDPGVNRILAAGAHAGVPVNIMCSGKLPLLRESGSPPSGHPGGDRSCGPGPAIRAAAVAGTFCRPGQRDFAGRIRQRSHQDFRGLYPVSRAIPIPRHLGASEPGIRRVRL